MLSDLGAPSGGLGPVGGDHCTLGASSGVSSKNAIKSEEHRRTYFFVELEGETALIVLVLAALVAFSYFWTSEKASENAAEEKAQQEAENERERVAQRNCQAGQKRWSIESLRQKVLMKRSSSRCAPHESPGVTAHRVVLPPIKTSALVGAANSQNILDT